jgi:hypothetical protein
VILSLFILATLAGGVISFGLFEKGSFDALDATSRAALQAQLAAKGADPAEIAKQAIDHVMVGGRALYILWVFGFLAGFSERFAWDFVDRAQGVTSGSGNGKKAP